MFVCVGISAQACKMPVEARRGTGYSGAGVTGIASPQGECWEQNWGPLQKHHLLT